MKPRKQVPLQFALFLLALILSPVIAAQKAAKKDDKVKVNKLEAAGWSGTIRETSRP